MLCPGSSASPWFTASCCRDGSLAVIQPLWVQQTVEESCSCGSVHPHFAGDVHVPVRVASIEKEGSCPNACATCPMLVGRDRSSRNGSTYQDRSPRWVGLHGPTQASMGQQNKLLHALKAGNPEEKIWSFYHPVAATLFKTATNILGLSGMTVYQTRVRGSRTLQEVQRRG